MNKIIAIGDVHGCYDLLVEAIEPHLNTEVELIFIGVNTLGRYLVQRILAIIPVFRFNETPVGDGKFGKITQKILKTWGENVDVDIISQIKKFGEECKDFNKNNSPTPYQFSSTPDAPQ